MDADEFLLYYRDLEDFVGWNEDDGRRVAGLGPGLEPRVGEFIEALQQGLGRCPDAEPGRATDAGPFERLETALREWLANLCTERADGDHASRCQRVGARFADVGVGPGPIHFALSRLAIAVHRAAAGAGGDFEADAAALGSLDKRLDLELALVWNAYASERARRLQRAERLAAIGQFAGGVAHELRQPLNILRTSAYYLLRAKEPSPEKTAEHLERIERQVALADRVIHAMSAFARLPAPDVRPVSIACSLDEALQANPVPSGIDVSIECPENLDPVPADAVQLQIVFGNLLRNASDAMPDGGRLSITVREDAEQVEIAVADTGQGIEASDLDRVTEPLYTTKARGMGLGLAITRAILEKHGGGIRAQSEPGKGATFTVTLPRTAAGEVEAESGA
jgi:two-component system NtrC family sensor kinase